MPDVELWRGRVRLTRREGDRLDANLRIHVEQPCLNRFDLQLEEHVDRLAGLAEAGALRRDDPEQRWRDAVRGQHVVARGVLDAGELVIGADLRDWQDLDPAILAARLVDEQVLKIARPLRLLQRGADRLHVAVGELAGRVQDEARMAAVEVVFAAE